MNVKKAKINKEKSLPIEDCTLESCFRVSEVPKSIEFKHSCFSPSKSQTSPNKSSEKKTLDTSYNQNSHVSTTKNKNNQINLTEIIEDGEDDGPNIGIQQQIQATILGKTFLNKSIMDFNKSKGYCQKQVFTEPNFHSTPDVMTQFRANSENFFNIEEKYSIYENQHEIYKKKINKNNIEAKQQQKIFHPTFKLDFKQKLPPTDEKVGLSSRLNSNLEEDLKFLRKMKAENLQKKKQDKKKAQNSQQKIGKDLEIFQLHENFEKNLELFKKEEEEFLRKIKKINLLEEDSSNENATHEKSKLEKEFEESLFHIVLEENTIGKETKDFDKKLIKENFTNEVCDSKLSRNSLDSKLSSKIFYYFYVSSKKIANFFRFKSRFILNKNCL